MLCLKRLLILMIIGFQPRAGSAAEEARAVWLESTSDIGLGFGLITLWGVDRWNWFQQSSHAVDEHGFSHRSKTGGADKTGHFMSSYLIGELLAERLENRGYRASESALVSSLASVALMTWIEIGDSTSRYGFSSEDLAADYLGAAMNYILRTSPAARRKLDLRIEYWPSAGNEKNNDVVADYSGMKHVAALKFSGFDWSQGHLLQYFEWQLGYYSRGFRSFDTAEKKRVLYTAIGINLSQFFAERSVGHKAFRYLQLPHTYVPLSLHETASQR